MPVIVISSLGQASCKAALEALQSGAVEVLAKPGGPYSVGELRLALAARFCPRCALSFPPQRRLRLRKKHRFATVSGDAIFRIELIAQQTALTDLRLPDRSSTTCSG